VPGDGAGDGDECPMEVSCCLHWRHRLAHFGAGAVLYQAVQQVTVTDVQGRCCCLHARRRQADCGA